MSDLVTVTIDGTEISVPKGTLVVDAAKKIGIDIPVFCYHPKMSPVGMCRMCLVEIGLPMMDRATGQPMREADGSVKLNFGKGLQTGCTVTVAPGMVVRTTTKPVDEAREAVIEFLLSSHPLDCPICDKGGECPLQNLTMAHGRGESRFDFTDKQNLEKRVPLGDLIFLDRERCIQCARCVRFQDEVVDDPVLGFHNRGRRLEIVTLSEPGFDSYWSGNTTDICPVGALTTEDFRFGARPWELTPVATVCPHCPVGCNMTMSTRREAMADGRVVIKRMMPRQNEQVNEIWICDKGRFVHHFADHPDRLTTPLVRKNGQLVKASWAEAIELVSSKLEHHKSAVAGLANDRLSNEDLYLFQKFFRQGLNSRHLDLADKRLGGGEVVAKVGLTSGSNLGELGKGAVILVVAADLHEEAPVWWLRVKQAAERGATVIVANVRPTRLDKWAKHQIRYGAGEALPTVRQLLNFAKVLDVPAQDELTKVAKAISESNSLTIFYGNDGLTYAQTETLAGLLGNLLLLENGAGQKRAGTRNSGLVAVWHRNNSQGAWDMGICSQAGMKADEIYAGVRSGAVKALYLLGADPIGDGYLKDRGKAEFVVVQELFLTETAKQADVVLPAQSWAEREGTFTNGERRVQRFYPAIEAIGESRPDWQILSQIGERLGLGKPKVAASLVFKQLAAEVPTYQGLDYRTLSRVEKQWPDVGGEDLYYGGNAYHNQSGLGQQWAVAAEKGEVAWFDLPASDPSPVQDLAVVYGSSLYAPSTLTNKSAVIDSRLTQPRIWLNPVNARQLAVKEGDQVALRVNGRIITAEAKMDTDISANVAVVQGIEWNAGTLKLESWQK